MTNGEIEPQSQTSASNHHSEQATTRAAETVQPAQMLDVQLRGEHHGPAATMFDEQVASQIGASADRLNAGIALMRGAAPQKYAQLQPPGQASDVSGHFAQGAIGRIDKVAGDVTVMRNGVSVTLHAGDAIYKNDVIKTGSASSVSIVLSDGTALHLAANTRMAVDGHSAHAGSDSNVAALTLLEGTFAFIAGKLADSGDLTIGTPVATMHVHAGAAGWVHGLTAEESASVSAKLGGISYSFALIDHHGARTHGSYDLLARGTALGSIGDPHLISYVDQHGELVSLPLDASGSSADGPMREALQWLETNTVTPSAVGGIHGSGSPIDAPTFPLANFGQDLPSFPDLNFYGSGPHVTVIVSPPDLPSPSPVHSNLFIWNGLGQWDRDPFNWNQGFAPTAATDIVIIQSGKASYANSYTIASLTVNFGAILNITGGSLGVPNLANAGLIQLNSSGVDPSLRIIGAVSLAGRGSIDMLGPTAGNFILGAAGTGAVLTNVDNLIAGSGNIGVGDGQLVFVNKGTVDATPLGEEDTGRLVIHTGNKVDNFGLLEATLSGELLVEDRLFNEGSVRATGAGSTILIDVQGPGPSGPAVVNAGLFEAADRGLLEIESSLDNAADIAARNGGKVLIAADINNEDGASIVADGKGAQVTFVGAAGDRISVDNAGAIAAVDGGSVGFSFARIANGEDGSILASGRHSRVDVRHGFVGNAGAIAAENGGLVAFRHDRIDNDGLIGAEGKGSAIVFERSRIDNAGGIIAREHGEIDVTRSQVDNHRAGTILADGRGSEIAFDRDRVDNSGLIEAARRGEVVFERSLIDNERHGVIAAEGGGAEVRFACADVRNSGLIEAADRGEVVFERSLIDNERHGVIAAEGGGAEVRFECADVRNSGLIEATHRGDVVFERSLVDNERHGEIVADGKGAEVRFGRADVHNAGLIEATHRADVVFERSLIDNACHGVIEADGRGAEVRFARDQVENSGKIEAECGGLVEFHRSDVENDGIISARGGVIAIDHSDIDNACGLITADGCGSFIDLKHATITGGELSGLGGGLIQTIAGSGNSDLADVAITGDSHVRITSGSTLTLDSGTTMAGGELDIDAHGTLHVEPDLAILSGVNVVNHGDIVVDPGLATLRVEAGTIITGGNLTVGPDGTLDVGGSTLRDVAIFDAGIVNFGAGNTLSPDDVLTFVGNGMVSVEDLAGFDITLAGLDAGDVIDLTNNDVHSAVWTGTTLLLDGAPVAFSVQGGLPTGDTFAFRPDGHGGTELVILPQLLVNLGATPETGVEGAPIPLEISFTGLGSTTLTSLVISDIPPGAVLSDGVNSFTASAGSKEVDVGGWTLGKLTITTENDSDFTLSATVTVTDANGNSYSAATTETVTLSPLPPNVSFTQGAVSGTEGTPIAIALDVSAAGLSGDASHNTIKSIVISGLPEGAILSDGVNTVTAGQGTNAVDVTLWSLAKLTVTGPDNASFTLTATVTEQDADNPAQTSTSVALEDVTVTPPVPSVSFAARAAAGPEGTPIAIALSAVAATLPADQSPNTLKSVVISGIPDGAILSDGNHSFTASSGHDSVDVKDWALAALTITPPTDADFQLTATVTEQSGANPGATSTATATEQVTVSPLPPSVTWSGNGVIAQHGVPIHVVLTAGVGGTPDDTAHNSIAAIVISGIPEGATLSDGTHTFTASNAVTSQDVTGWSLSDLTVTPATDGMIALTATAVETDSDNPAQISIAVATAVNEGIPAGSVVYSAAAAGPAGPGLTYILANADPALGIDAATGDVTLNAVPSFEAHGGTYSFDVIVSAANGVFVAEQAVTVAVNDLPPAFSSPTTATVDEGTSTATVVYQALAAEPGGNPVTYSLLGADAAAFTIDPVTGAVTFKAVPSHDLKPSYDIVVQADETHGGHLSAQQAVTIHVAAVAPTFISAPTADVAEATAKGTTVYTAVATEPGGHGTITYSLLPGGDASSFSIDAHSGAVTLETVPDFETKSSYSFTVQATETSGLSTTQTVTLAVDDLPPVISSADHAVITSGTPTGTTVYKAVAADPAGGAVTYALVGGLADDASAFQIDAATGAVTSSFTADLALRSNYHFTIAASDPSGATSTEAVTIDVVPPLTVVAGATVRYSGGGAPVTLDSTLTVTDLDGSMLQSATVTISSGLAPGDTLAYDDTLPLGDGGIIHAIYNNGVLTLTAGPGGASAADFQQALRAVTYSDGKYDPTNGGADTSRTIAWYVSDSVTNSAVVTSHVTTTHVAPIVTPPTSFAAFQNSGAPVILADNISVLDDNGVNASLADVQVQLLNAQAGDRLSFNHGTNTMSFGDGATITGSYQHGILTLVGASTSPAPSVADFQAAMRSVAYSFEGNDASIGGTNSAREIYWVVHDGNTVNGTNEIAGAGTVTADNYQPWVALNQLVVTEGVFPSSGDGSGHGIPMAAIRTFAGGFAVGGTAQAKGQIVSISQNTTLFSLLGPNYGGNGFNSFALPDLQGTVAIGQGAVLSDGAASSADPSLALGDKKGSAEIGLTLANVPQQWGGGGRPFDNDQPSLAINYMIRVAGQLPNSTGGASTDLAGEVIPYLGVPYRVPDGYLFAEGQTLNIADYQELFYVIGNAYGGDGVTTFKLPNLVNATIIGAGNGSSTLPPGTSGGTDTISLAPTNLGPPQGGALPISNDQPTVALSYLIAYEGVFPSSGGEPDPNTPFIGEIMAFAGRPNNIPHGWILADGRTLPINQFQVLFAVLGTHFGGDGKVGFKLPDLVGKVVVGTGSHAGQTFTIGQTGGQDSFEIFQNPGLPTVATTTLLAGAASLQVPAGSIFELAGGSNQAVTFADVTGTLKLDDPAGFSGHIINFAGANSDAIDVVGIDFRSALFTASYGNGVLQLNDGAHGASLSFDNFADLFALASDGAGGTLINHQTATIAPGAVLEISSFTIGTVRFDDATGTLKIDAPGLFSGHVQNFMANASGSDTIDLAGIDFTAAGFTESYDAGTGRLTVGDGSHSASLILDGLGGALDFGSDGHGGTVITSQPAGPMTIASGHLLEVWAPSSATITFLAGTGELKLDDPASFSGHIAGFTGTAPDAAHSDVIDLVGIDFNSSQFIETYDPQSGAFTISDGAHHASFWFDNFSPQASFKFQSDGHGGTLILDPPKSAAATETGGDNFTFHFQPGVTLPGTGGFDGHHEWADTSAAGLQVLPQQPDLGHADWLVDVGHHEHGMVMSTTAQQWQAHLQSSVSLH
ncbi:tail fiber protein [Bradyrhizobium sp. HKCCYLS2038]|uniref:tail fiber protein n=1 Tax=unclassified Bradyrhizobium TaxID=2631580 RepID=UPI003EBC3E8C